MRDMGNALVTGGADGIGFAIAQALAAAGYCVTVSYTHLTLPTKRIV